jgi:hypothetical protein
MKPLQLVYGGIAISGAERRVARLLSPPEHALFP